MLRSQQGSPRAVVTCGPYPKWHSKACRAPALGSDACQTHAPCDPGTCCPHGLLCLPAPSLLRSAGAQLSPHPPGPPLRSLLCERLQSSMPAGTAWPNLRCFFNKSLRALTANSVTCASPFWAWRLLPRWVPTQCLQVPLSSCLICCSPSRV